jgi:hypothetical protein
VGTLWAPCRHRLVHGGLQNPDLEIAEKLLCYGAVACLTTWPRTLNLPANQQPCKSVGPPTSMFSEPNGKGKSLAEFREPQSEFEAGLMRSAGGAAELWNIVPSNGSRVSTMSLSTDSFDSANRSPSLPAGAQGMLAGAPKIPRLHFVPAEPRAPPPAYVPNGRSPLSPPATPASPPAPETPPKKMSTPESPYSPSIVGFGVESDDQWGTTVDVRWLPETRETTAMYAPSPHIIASLLTAHYM